MPSVDWSNTISVSAVSPRMTMGDAQLAAGFRSVRQRVSPVAASIPAANESP